LAGFRRQLNWRAGCRGERTTAFWVVAWSRRSVNFGRGFLIYPHASQPVGVLNSEVTTSTREIELMDTISNENSPNLRTRFQDRSQLFFQNNPPTLMTTRRRSQPPANRHCWSHDSSGRGTIRGRYTTGGSREVWGPRAIALGYNPTTTENFFYFFRRF